VSDSIVSTGLGRVRGSRSEAGTGTWRGVPYAAPTAGPGRWSPPAPPAPWPGERDARSPGPICPQPARPFSEWAHGPLVAAGEDCLSVNVFSPPGEGPHPVLVFLHGGGWALGWGSNPLLDGEHLACRLDAVIVTINYRLGSLGWLWHPELAAEPGAPAGNWGLLDQLAALRWVAENISAFGGDPARVTLAGESAGAGSVLHLLCQPEAAGLFARAIAQSPPLHELVVGAELGAAWSEAVVARLTGGTDVSSGLETLRERPAQAIVDVHEELLATPAFRGTRGGAMPIVDPASLPVDPAQVPAVRPEIPVLIGTNSAEGTFFFRAGGRRIDPDEARLEGMVAHLTGSEDPRGLITLQRERASAAGRSAAANDILCAIVTEAWFAAPVRRWSAARAAAGAAVHRYLLDHPASEDDLGATHSLDVPLLYESWRDGGVAERLAGGGETTAAVSQAMTADWRRFVHAEAMEWPPLPADRQDGRIAVYGAEGRPREIADAADDVRWPAAA
jgi:para-nitrobenzyl esterase